MATGIVSTSLAISGWRFASLLLLAFALIALAVLLVLYAWRFVAFPQRVIADSRSSAHGFGFFTIVAALNVVGIRLALEQHLWATAVLALISVPIWVFLTYAVPISMVAGRRRADSLDEVNGSWFLWVVGTQSLAASAATIAGSVPMRAAWLGPVAVSLWGVGVVLYLMLVGLVAVNLFDDPVAPQALGPSSWIYMGATAITLLASARILALPVGWPVLAATREVVSGIGFVLWAFGTWWIPLLFIFAVWRYLAHDVPFGYEPGLWSMVFPLGMYAVASISYGRVAGLGFMVEIGRVELWVGFAAWVVVALSMAVSFAFPDRGAAPDASRSRLRWPRAAGRSRRVNG